MIVMVKYQVAEIAYFFRINLWDYETK